MEEGYLRWRDDNWRSFPWPDINVHSVTVDIAQRLAARGLYPYSNVFCWETVPGGPKRGCPDDQHPHYDQIANRRAIAAVNTWGPHLFPLIDSNEVRLDGLRVMPNLAQGVGRAPYYAVTGIADVISSVRMNEVSQTNRIVHYLRQNPAVRGMVADFNDYEIIIDYKGMRRPGTGEPSWNHHEWQLLTYMWLRQQQLRSQEGNPRAIAAAVIFYLNELEPSEGDNKNLKANVQAQETDVIPVNQDFSNLMNVKNLGTLRLSDAYREARSIKVIPYDINKINSALASFDNVVRNIETRVLTEMGGSTGLRQCWREGNPQERNCTACDAKTICPNAAPRPYSPTVP